MDSFYKFKSNRKNKYFIHNKFKNILIFIFLDLFSNSFEKTEITLVINGKGKQKVISDSFNPIPSKIIGSDIEQCINKRECVLKSDTNKVTIKFNSLIISCNHMFSSLSSITEIDLSNFDTSSVTDMAFMFNDCINMEKVIFGNIKTSKAENMYGLFNNCIRLISVDLSNFDTSSVTDMGYMFRNCKSLKSIDASKFNTKKVTNMFDMFGYCVELIYVNASNFNTSNVEVMQGMFYKCYKLKYLNLSNFDFSTVKNTDLMFEFDNFLEYINLYSIRIKNNMKPSFISENLNMYKRYGNSKFITN